MADVSFQTPKLPNVTNNMLDLGPRLYSPCAPGLSFQLYTTNRKRGFTTVPRSDIILSCVAVAHLKKDSRVSNGFVNARYN